MPTSIKRKKGRKEKRLHTVSFFANVNTCLSFLLFLTSTSADNRILSSGS